MKLAKDIEKRINSVIREVLGTEYNTDKLPDEKIDKVVEIITNDEQINQLLELDELIDLVIDKIAENGNCSIVEEILKEVQDEAREELETAVLEYRSIKDLNTWKAQEIFQIIYDRYDAPLKGLAFRCGNPDLAQELMIVLLDAINNFDINRKIKFNTYFWSCARKYIGSQKIRNNAKKRKAEVVSMNAPIDFGDGVTTMEDYISDEKISSNFDLILSNLDLEEWKKTLKQDERTAIDALYYGGCKYKDIAEQLGITIPGVAVKFKRLGQKASTKKALL